MGDFKLTHSPFNINIMRKTSSGNFILSSREFIDLYGFVSYLLTLPRVPFEEYQSVDYVMLSKHDIELFKKLERFGDESFRSNIKFRPLGYEW